MTCMPESRSARATTLIPRSCPSSPTFANTIRMRSSLMISDYHNAKTGLIQVFFRFGLLTMNLNITTIDLKGFSCTSLPMMTDTLPLPVLEPLADEQYLCRCLRITKADVIETIVTLGLQSFEELRRCTAAGDGCTACHVRLRECVERYACP